MEKKNSPLWKEIPLRPKVRGAQDNKSIRTNKNIQRETEKFTPSKIFQGGIFTSKNII